jgi:hypothetical protein
MSSEVTSVLVLYESFAVATVVLGRLLDLPMVHMVRAEHVNAVTGRYDVIVVDPYLRAHRRAEVLRRWGGPAAPVAAVIELCDLGGGAGAALLCGDVDHGAGAVVWSALGLDAVAA